MLRGLTPRSRASSWPLQSRGGWLVMMAVIRSCRVGGRGGAGVVRSRRVRPGLRWRGARVEALEQRDGLQALGAHPDQAPVGSNPQIRPGAETGVRGRERQRALDQAMGDVDLTILLAVGQRAQTVPVPCARSLQPTGSLITGPERLVAASIPVS
jgi:hypothetical protein